ncbi:MAG: ATP-dependent Clp protease ATP-binding subunit [Candidatus Liptonbacteria bacterium]|nr:ATP-dependent Clp protease ATP-binding subunit [Candidatus Liptonbacteria bacterium]
MRITFSEPRFHISFPGRIVARIALYSLRSVGVIATIVFLIVPDVSRLFWIGVLGALFFADKMYHAGSAKDSLLLLPPAAARGEREVNAASYVAPASYRILESAYDAAVLSRGNFHLHLLEKLLDHRDVAGAFVRMGTDRAAFRARAQEAAREAAGTNNGTEDLTGAVTAIAQSAFLHAFHDGDAFIEPSHLFSALGEARDPAVGKLFALFQVAADDVRVALLFARYRPPLIFRWRAAPFVLGAVAYHPRSGNRRAMNRAWTARFTPTLDRFSTDLTESARAAQVGFLVGHEQEYGRLVDILSRSGSPNVLLIGEPGVGKESIVAHLAREIVQDRVPPELFDKRLVMIPLGPLTAGAPPEELRKRAETVFEEVARAGNIVLYIPEIHTAAKAGGAGEMTLADILLPIIASNRISVIGGTYPREFRSFIESRTDFTHAFELIRVNELSEPEALRFLVYQGILLEWQYRIMIHLSALKTAVTIAHAHFHDQPLPSGAVRLLGEALSEAAEQRKKTLTPDDIIAIAERKTNVPLHDVNNVEAEGLLQLEERIHRDLIDQEYAVTAVARAMREYRSGLRSGGPIAAFLFAGPTGVGKTELAKILTEVQFKSRDAMVRFDMSEYQTRESIARFIGSSDGSVPGALTEAVRAAPYGLVLLDEFEKANDAIHNLFLQVFDEGRLTDALGRTVDFTNTILVATSNALSQDVLAALERGTPMDDVADDLKKRLTTVFRPELVNRFTDVIVFRALSPDDILAIARLHLKKLAGQLRDEKGISLAFAEDAVSAIARLGYSPTFGARPLKNAISEHIRSRLAELILRRTVVAGSSVAVSFTGTEFVFSVR